MSDQPPAQTVSLGHWLLHPGEWTLLQAIALALLALLALSMVGRWIIDLPNVSDFLAIGAVALLGTLVAVAAWHRLVRHD